MEFALGLLLGAVVGVIAERLLGYPFDTWVLRPLAGRRERRRLRQLNADYAVSGEVVVIGDTGIFVNQFFPTGIEASHLYAQMIPTTRTLTQRLGESDLTPPGLTVETLDAIYRRWIEELELDPHAWNGVSLALSRCEVGRVPTTEEPVLNLWFTEADYASARAAEEVWWTRPVEERRGMRGETLREVDPFFCNGFGLNCTVETADGLVLVGQRGSHARGWSGYWHTSFNEGVSVADRMPGGRVDITAAFGRGLTEELGIDPVEIVGFRERLSIHSLILDVDNYQWGLLAHLDLRDTEFTSERIRGLRNLGAAPDDWEASEIRFIEFASSTVDVHRELERADRWVPHGLLNVALSALVRHPSQARHIRRELLRAR